MLDPALAARRLSAVLIGAGVLSISAIPSASADPFPPPAPGCSAADFEQVTSQVSSATSAYLFTHPDANAFFSTLKGQPKDQTRGQVETYLNDNPQTKSDLAGIRQPLRDMKDRCQ